MYTIAYHGDGATPQKLAKDIGPDIKINHYWPNLNKQQALNWLIEHPTLAPFNLIGYSRGGYIITHITQTHHHLINAAILYEIPVLEYNQAPGTYPVLMIWNKSKNQNKDRKNTPEGQKTIKVWSQTHPITNLEGKGGHTRYQYWPPSIRHNWDQTLNQQINHWLETVNLQNI